MLRNLIEVFVLSVGIFVLNADKIAYAQSGNDRKSTGIVQMLLNAHGYNVGTPDGIAGTRTNQALRAFADKHNVEASVGDVLRFAMQRNIEQREEITNTEFVERIENSVKDELRNSDSAQFRNMYLISGASVIGSSAATYVCGEVNSENAYGGMTGYHYFFGTSFSSSAGDLFLFSRLDSEEQSIAELVCTLTFE